MQQYLIHEDNLERLSKKLNTIEKKCNKYGIHFHYAEIGEEFIEYHCGMHRGERFSTKITEQNRADVYKQVEEKFGKIVTRRFVLIEVEGIAKINDWEFIGTIEHTKEGNLIKQYKTNVEVPNHYRYSGSVCEHCNSDRNRKDTYIVQNTITKEFKQVGKSCLLSFTNGLSAEGVAQYLSYFEELATFDSKDSMGGYIKEYLDVKEYLLYVIETVKFHGFISFKKQQEIVEELTKGLSPEESNFLLESANIPSCTSTQSLEYMWASKAPYGNRTYFETQKKMIAMGFKQDQKENEEKLQIMLEWINSQNADSQYISNLQILCRLDFCEFKNAGILASLTAAYQKFLDKDKEKQIKIEQDKKSNFVGAIGEKIIINNATIKRTGGFETQFGFTNIITITDSDNNVFVWFTASHIDFEEDKRYNVKGTVKEHKLYGSLKQTIITRCKIEGDK